MSSYSLDEAIQALTTNSLTVVVVSPAGKIVALEAYPVELPSEELMDDVMRRHRGNSVSFLPRGAYSPEAVAEIIRDSVEAIELTRAGALRPGANAIRRVEE